MNQQKTFLISTVSVAALVFFILGTYVGYTNRPAVESVVGITHTETPETISGDFEPFWKAWNILDDKSAYAKETTGDDKVWGAIQGLASSFGDPYTEFFNPEETTYLTEALSGAFSGVGMEVGKKDDLLVVIAPIKGTPAYRAGIKNGDIITKIDDFSTADMAVDEAITHIRGTAGTTVTITVFRPEETEPREFKITREIINVPILDTTVDGDTFVLTVYSFTGSDTEHDLQNAIREFSNSGKQKLIIDLRNNPGGYLDAAVYLASFFLPEGEMVVTEDYGTKRDPIIHKSEGFTDLKEIDPKIAVLVDGGSASASEIFAGAIADNHKGILVGERTFGKGSVQEIVPITNDTVLKITVAKWLTPKGISIQKEGITPEYIVAQDPKTEKDEVLIKAELLLQ